MPVKVIDASALAAILFNEPDAGRVVAAISDDGLVAPQLIWFEIASVCLKKMRAHARRRDAFLGALQLMERLDIELAAVDLPDAITLAENSGLTVYDACYLWLARLLKCELVTLDRRLDAAFRR